ncbi:drug resistance transporter, EmrB/QacA subfamily [Pseudonocardia ammonioxydans]|uniref:Drug resistance transporter, EmrB/QacA subfamily n=1 Tax=Pseudonocardia ammonioxydans TaxID=260086 RepID=A0A1I4ZZT4_PSUAM|nr:MFS transporter [Pseudonocardia ammonioxydans]SFN55722.1 drug resistance transporter, EmrB/QacA subfamily [Pseudonocardia ammonioxydans]
MTSQNPEPVALSSPAGRFLILTATLGSGIAFLDGSVVTVALPTIGRELGGGIAVLQWVVDGYLLTLSALLLLGGALGDRYGRRRLFVIGLVVFTLASLACGLAPTGGALIGARLVQGIGGALLVPGSLALIDASIRRADRGKAIGVWAGLSGVTSALGPFVGGWLVSAVSWRWIFLINVPLAAIALIVALRHVAESRDPAATGRPDLAGAACVTLGLSGVVYALIEGPSRGWTPITVGALVVGIVGLVAFPLVERRRPEALLPPALFRSLQFSGANLTTFAVYAALTGGQFLLTLQLQQNMGYSALAAGLATLPMTVIMLVLSPVIGGFAQRVGPRLPMTVGPFVVAGGLALLTRAVPGSSYAAGVLPGVLVFGLGLAVTVAPLTATVLAAVDEQHVGTASGVNNAVARTAGLLAVALLPPVAGLSGDGAGALGAGFARGMLVAAGLCVAGGVVAFLTIDRAVPVRRQIVPGLQHSCQHPRTRETSGPG